MRYGHLLGTILLILFAFGLMYALGNSDSQKIGLGAPKPQTQYTAPANQGNPAAKANAYVAPSIQYSALVVYTDSGFSPETISVPKGTAVIFENRSANSFWPASEIYPGTGSCGRMLDSCAPVPYGQTWSFTFDRIGTWTYHNHAQTGHRGTIIVK